MIFEREVCAPICPPGGACTPAELLIQKPSTAPSPTHTNYAPAGGPQPSFSLSSQGLFCHTPSTLRQRLLSLPQRFCSPCAPPAPPPHHHQPHPLTRSLCQPYIWRPRGATDSLPVASRSWAKREGPPAAAWKAHPSSQHPLSAPTTRNSKERV